MCRAKPYPRCSSHARERLHAALASGDRERIRRARRDWYTSPAGITELRQAGQVEEAAKFEARRARLIRKAKQLAATQPKIRLGLDLDNTTGDFTAGLRAQLAKKYGYTPEQALAAFPDPSDYSFVKSGWFKSPEEFAEVKDAAEAAGVYRNMTFYPEAIKTLRKLVKSGKVEVHVITAREQLWNADTLAWLKDNIPYASLTHTDTKEATDMDVYLDDATYQLTNLHAHGKRVIAFDQIYNRSADLNALPRVRNWAEVPAVLRLVAKQPAPAANAQATVASGLKA